MKRFIELIARLPERQTLVLGVEEKTICGTLVENPPDGGWKDSDPKYKFDPQCHWGVNSEIDDFEAFERLLLGALEKHFGSGTEPPKDRVRCILQECAQRLEELTKK